ncbi:hypothetical protein [Chryseobacterium sp. JV274]|uniref:hypothetical protein n=1 Tax=unclassified Chryseobacterium TaxID=2593645 RepID=UPI001E441BBA|nr:hypothetical protein [Chryseobacterium sp. JV274]
MKKILIIAGILAVQLSFAQQGAFSEVTIQNPSPILYLKRSTNDGGFIRGIQTQYFNGDNGWFFGDLHGSQWIVSKGDYTNPKLVINDSNGYVGIGTVTPLSKLHVAGTIMAGAGDSVTGVNAFSIPYGSGSMSNWGALRSSGSSYMSYGVKANGANVGWLSSSGEGNFVKTAITLDNEGFRLLASASQQSAIDSPVSMPEIMKVSSNGNALLQGKLEAKEIKVTLSPTADFVFEENYDLPNLEEVAKHIKEKKHLPEIASAKVMEKEGVNVGEFQIKLLQKIEELTLYAIKQERQLKDQQEKVQKLEEENADLKNAVSEIKQLKEQFLRMKSETTH